MRYRVSGHHFDDLHLPIKHRRIVVEFHDGTRQEAHDKFRANNANYSIQTCLPWPVKGEAI